MDIIINKLINILSIELAVLFTAVLPIIELRGAIPVGMAMEMDPINVTVLSFIGSMLPVPILLFGIRPVFNYLRKTKLFRNIVDKLTNRSMKKSHKVQKYGLRNLWD